LNQDLNVQTLAGHAAMSPRTFARRFSDLTGSTPHRWLCRQRVLLAQRLLETTDVAVEQIADQCGLGTAANLRLHFRAEIGVSPAAYRRTFRQDPAA
jgi:transcriptional regulator GlxA family with amidase domain